MMNREQYRRDLALAGEYGAWLSGKRVLITGATGMIGSFLVETLSFLNESRGAGIEIYAAGRSDARLRERFGRVG